MESVTSVLSRSAGSAGSPASPPTASSTASTRPPARRSCPAARRPRGRAGSRASRCSTSRPPTHPAPSRSAPPGPTLPAAPSTSTRDPSPTRRCRRAPATRSARRDDAAASTSDQLGCAPGAVTARRRTPRSTRPRESAASRTRSPGESQVTPTPTPPPPRRRPNRPWQLGSRRAREPPVDGVNPRGDADEHLGRPRVGLWRPPGPGRPARPAQVAARRASAVYKGLWPRLPRRARSRAPTRSRPHRGARAGGDVSYHSLFCRGPARGRREPLLVLELDALPVPMPAFDVQCIDAPTKRSASGRTDSLPCRSRWDRHRIVNGYVYISGNPVTDPRRSPSERRFPAPGGPLLRELNDSTRASRRRWRC